MATDLGPGKTRTWSVAERRSWEGVEIIHDVSARDIGAGALGDSLGNLLDLGVGDQERNVDHVVTESLLILAPGLDAGSTCGLHTE